MHWLRNIPLSRGIPVLFVICTIFIILSFTTAKAGGLYLNEFGTSAMGTAGAGAQAYANDASTAWHNPAGMTRIDGRQFGAAAGLVFWCARQLRVFPASLPYYRATKKGGQGVPADREGPVRFFPLTR